jgi:hypothetical protein
LATTSLSWLHVSAVYDALDSFMYLHEVEKLKLDYPSAANLLPLHYACYAGSLEVATYIMMVDRNQATLLVPGIPHQLLGFAAQSKDASILQLLLDNGADPTAKLNVEDRHLDIAIDSGAVECAEMLFRASQRTHAQGNGYWHACFCGVHRLHLLHGTELIRCHSQSVKSRMTCDGLK